MEIVEIEVEIDEKGEVTLKVRGAPGKKCLEMTGELEKALGAEIISRVFTSEIETQEEQDINYRTKNQIRRSK